MIRRPPRSTQSRSSAASDVYKRQAVRCVERLDCLAMELLAALGLALCSPQLAHRFLPPPRSGVRALLGALGWHLALFAPGLIRPVSYTHLRAHETVLDLVCRLLLEKKKQLRLTLHIIYIVID
eukprot:TRINITY_DN26173_c0_g1_i1.p1 TRINITY_DN26173_c0_g1~~TRINITY_DN26173_c0_g1_i1.p1  ORF type:complete len:124 (-),score=61.25 TRINITY_DN26173_c0_g1_i1:25-396(-)